MSNVWKDFYVFPGGVQEKVDAKGQYWESVFRDDLEIYNSFDEKEFKFRITAIREVFEETGIALIHPPSKMIELESNIQEWRDKVHRDANLFVDFFEHFKVRPSIESLKNWAHWITPKQEKRRYDTRFFIANLNHVSDHFVHCGTETKNSLWLAPEEVMEAFAKGTIKLAPPTWFVIRELMQFPTIEELLNAKRDMIPIEPNIVSQPHAFPKMVIALPGDPLHHETKGMCDTYNRIEVEEFGKNTYKFTNHKIPHSRL